MSIVRTASTALIPLAVTGIGVVAAAGDAAAGILTGSATVTVSGTTIEAVFTGVTSNSDPTATCYISTVGQKDRHGVVVTEDGWALSGWQLPAGTVGTFHVQPMCGDSGDGGGPVAVGAPVTVTLPSGGGSTGSAASIPLFGSAFAASGI
ncbi:hypothetical protein [Nocardia stercoris]|uniref:Uncharacterized protein n=1 Tax=Nocardia stercoris TaxID=2483361 RepID=A0A3M2KZP2_9NOCA|nr:hypothetical protein [Nocardia stercoris]RMI29015.1 hypothetical protein EBN03_28220 [Nocardia stercoris]